MSPNIENRSNVVELVTQAVGISNDAIEIVSLETFITRHNQWPIAAAGKDAGRHLERAAKYKHGAKAKAVCAGFWQLRRKSKAAPEKGRRHSRTLTWLRRRIWRRWDSGLSPELSGHQLVEQCRVGLPLRRLHNLPHKKSRHRLLAGAILLNLPGICSDDLVDHGLDGGGIGELLWLL